MKFVIYLLFFVLSFSCLGQTMIPFEIQGFDETIFNEKDLASNSIKKVSCHMLSINTDLPINVDTLGQIVYYFNTDYKVYKSIYNDKLSGFVDSCYYTFSNDLKKMVCFNCVDSSCGKEVYLYNSDRIISYKSAKQQNNATNPSEYYTLRYDTLIYDNSNKIEKKINYYFNPDNTVLYDSVIRTYNYDYAGNLIKTSFRPSPTFKKNLPPRLHVLSSDEMKSYYKYNDDETIVDEYNYFYRGKTDSFLVSKSISRKYDFDKKLSFIKHTYNKDTDYDLTYINDQLSLEYALNEVRIIKYQDKTTLPRLITIHEGPNIHLYLFEYFPPFSED